MLWWQCIEHIGKILILLLLLFSEKIIGVPFASWLWFYHWYGDRIWQCHWYEVIVWATICSFLYQLPMGLTMSAVFVWLLLMEWGSHLRFKYLWQLVVTGFSAVIAALVLRSSWQFVWFWIIGQSLLWWWLRTRQKHHHYGF